MKKLPTPSRTPSFEVRHSRIHGNGVFATRRIRKGTTVVEYLGDRLSHAKADTRYEDRDPDDNHTFLFTVNARTVIDAGVNGNDARFINHGCEPNCESTIVKGRVFIQAIRTIQPGDELKYDYAIGRDSDDAANVDEVFACRCGAASCRGSMLEPKKKPRKAARKRRAKAGTQRAKAGRQRAKAGVAAGKRRTTKGKRRTTAAGRRGASPRVRGR